MSSRLLIITFRKHIEFLQIVEITFKTKKKQASKLFITSRHTKQKKQANYLQQADIRTNKQTNKQNKHNKTNKTNRTNKINKNKAGRPLPPPTS